MATQTGLRISEICALTLGDIHLGADAHVTCTGCGGLAITFTSLRAGEGWLFLATVIDLRSRMVVGWAMAEHRRTDLISAALRMAHTHGPLAPGAIFGTYLADD